MDRQVRRKRLNWSFLEHSDDKSLLIALLSVITIFYFVGIQLEFAVIAALPIFFLVKKATSTFLHKLLLALIILYPLFICLIQVAYYLDGTQGVDFGIFAQLISQVAERNRFMSSLVSTEWQNFLTHHFSPYLIILGIIAKIGISSAYLLIFVHILSIIALAIGLYKLFYYFIEDSTITAAFTLSSLLLPALRFGLSWETRDEVLALPFIVWSIYAHLSNRHNLKLLILVPILFFKETLAINVFGICLFFAIDKREARIASILMGISALSAFVIYTKVLPYWLWTPTFNVSTRIGSFESLVSQKVLLEKLLWLGTWLLPFIPFLFLHNRASLKQSFLILLTTLYSFLAITVTTFSDMYQPHKYYSITPVLIGFLAFSLPVLKNPHIIRSLCVSLVLITLYGPIVESRRIIADGFFNVSALSEIRSIIPSDKALIVDEYTTSILSDQKQVVRIVHANKMLAHFDYIVIRKSKQQKLSLYLRSWSKPCGETKRYLLRCALDKVKPRASIAPTSEATSL